MAKRGKLTPKQEMFVKEYLVDLNASAAARRAGYSPRTADRTGHENLKKPEIQVAIQKQRDKRVNNLDITIDRVLRERAKLAFFNALDMFNPDGTMKPITEISPDVAAALSGVDIKSTVGEDGQPAQILKFKNHDKNKALDALDKYLGLYEKDNAQRGQVDQEARQEFMRDLFQTISQANGRGLPEPRE
jgi:phage terminase small subunit